MDNQPSWVYEYSQKYLKPAVGQVELEGQSKQVTLQTLRED